MALNPYEDTLEQLEQQPGPSSTPAAAAPSNPFLDTLELEDERRAQELRAAVGQGMTHAPDAAAEARTIARRMGLPTSTVERNLPEFRRRAQIADTPYARMLRETPTVAAWASDADNAAIAHDDLEQLGAVERTLRIGENSVRAFGAGLTMGISSGAWGLARAGFEWAGNEELALFANQAAATAAHLRTKVRGDQGNIGGFERSVYGGLESAGLSVSALPAAALGGPAGVVAILGLATAGESYTQARQAGRTVERSTGFALGQGAIEAATEFIPAKWFLGDLAKQAPIWQTLAHQIASEIPGEQIATAAQDLNEWANVNGEGTLVDWAWTHRGDRLEAAADTLVATIVAAGGQTAIVGAVERATRKPTSQHVVEQLGATVADSKTATRSPESLEALVDQAAKNGQAPAHLYAPIDSWITYWQSQGEDPAAKAAELTGDPEAFARARAAGPGGMLQIRTGAYAAKLAATEHNAFFAQELKLDPEAPNGREFVEREAAAAEASATPATDDEAIRADIQGKLEAAGYEPSIAEATAHAMSGFGSIAERLGEEGALELYQRYGIQVEREGLPAAADAQITRNNALGGASEAGPAPSPLPDIPASTATAGENSQQYRARRQAHVAALGSALVRDAQRVDPTVDERTIREALESRLELLEERNAGQATETGQGQSLLRAIADYGGIWWERRTGALKGEIEHLNETGRDVAGVAAGSGRVKHIRGRATWNGVSGVFNEQGLPPDQMVRSLMQDPQFAYLEDDLNKLIDAIGEAMTAAPDVAALPGTDELDELGIKPGTAWWARGQRARVANSVLEGEELELADERDAVESDEDGDASFEFSQAAALPLDEAAFLDDRAYRDTLRAPYVQGDEVIASSRETPFEGELPPVGTWRIESTRGLYGREVAQLREVSIDTLQLPELDTRGQLDPVKRGDDARYAEWIREGRRAPGIEVVQTDKGGLRVVDGHRRVLAAKLAGHDTIEAWVWPTMPHPQGLRETSEHGLGQVMRVGATLEGLRGDQQFAQSDVPENELLPMLLSGAGVPPGEIISVRFPKPHVVEERVVEQQQPGAGDVAQIAADLQTRLAAVPTSRRRLAPSDDTTLHQGPRGTVRFNTRDRQFTITLSPKADLSTFLHEIGHVYLEVLGDVHDRLVERDPSTLTEMQRRLLADYATILEAAGVGTGKAITSRTELERDHHEWFARAFEAYLFEGKAPSVELRSAFARFRAWFVSIYRTIRNLDVELSDDVRGVMDRLMATDEAIAAARAEAQIVPAFTDAQSAGMTELEFASYLDTVREASAREQEELQARLLRDLKREEFGWYQAERERFRAEVEAELNAQPVYRALSVMRTGTYPDGSPIFPGAEALPLKLSRASLVAQFGRDILARLPRPYIYSAQSGITAGAAAELLGFSSGEALVEACIAARPFRQVVDEQVEARMLAKHGDVMRDGRLEELARAAVQGEHRQTVIRAELRALTRDMVRTTIPSADVINGAAQARVAATRIRDIRPGVHLQAARRAGAQAFALLSTGEDRAGAVRGKLQELVNLALYRESRDAKENVESMRRTLQQYGSKAALQRFGKAGAEYLEQIVGLLSRYELARVTQTELERRSALADFVEKMRAEEMPVNIPAQLLDESRRVNYQDLTLEEFRGLYDAVEHIAHLARLKNRLLKAAHARSFEEERDELVASIFDHNDRTPLPLEPGREKGKADIRDWFASHDKIAMIARAFDGHESGGRMWEAIIRPLNEAANAEASRKAAAGQAIGALLERAFPGARIAELRDIVNVPGVGSLSREARLAVALNWGNEGNRGRILADPSRKWSEADVERILATLSESDWQFVQGAWDFVDSFWPEIEAKQQRVTGLPPAKVPAFPFTVRTVDGVTLNLRGGYYPLHSEARLHARAGALEKGGTATLAASAGYVQATTARGHTEARKQHVKIPVRLELSVLFHHVDAVVHDLTHHEALIDVSRLLADADVSQAIFQTKGQKAYEQFTAAVADIARGREAPPGNVVEKALNYLRTGTQISMMGYSFWTGVQQPIGILNGASRIGVPAMMRGLTRWARDAAHMESTVAMIHERSEFMRNRHQTATQDLADVQAQLGQAGSWFDVMIRRASFDRVTQADLLNSFMWHIGIMQRVADVPTWLGEYEKQLAANPEDEARAVALADQAVLDSQGGGDIKDLAKMQRGGPYARLFMTFYSYGSTLYNATRDAAGATDFRKPRSVGTFLGHLSLLYLFPAFATIALRHAFGNDDDDEGWLTAVGSETLGTALNTMVGARELSGVGRVFFGGEAGVRGYSGPAGARFFETVYRLAAQVKQGEADEAALKAANQVLGVLFRYPALQVERTTDGIVALWEGRTRNPFALLVGAPND